MIFTVNRLGMVISFCVVGLVVAGVISDVATTLMKKRINEGLPDESKLAWWSRDYARVNRLYEGLHPESNLPDVARYSGYVAVGFFACLVLTALLAKS